MFNPTPPNMPRNTQPLPHFQPTLHALRPNPPPAPPALWPPPRFPTPRPPSRSQTAQFPGSAQRPGPGGRSEGGKGSEGGNNLLGGIFTQASRRLRRDQPPHWPKPRSNFCKKKLATSQSVAYCGSGMREQRLTRKEMYKVL